MDSVLCDLLVSHTRQLRLLTDNSPAANRKLTFVKRTSCIQYKGISTTAAVNTFLSSHSHLHWQYGKQQEGLEDYIM